MNMNPRQMKKMMQRMGIKQREVDSDRVIIESQDKDIVILNPQVVKVNMMGQDTFQISGQITEREKGIDPEDIETVMEKAGVDEETARKALEKSEGDLAKAILDLS